MHLVRTLTGHSEKSRQSMDAEASQPPIEHVPTGTVDDWSGHYNRLSEAQQTTLANFKKALQEQNLYTPEPASHDDPTLIRYLRARKFDLNGALAQFRETEKMRQDNKIHELYDHIDVDFYERARKLYPQWTGHRDKRGLPLYVYQIKHLDSKTVHQYTKDTEAWKKNSQWAKVPASSKLLPLYALYENMLTLVLPLCSTLERPVMDVPITQGTNIVDVSGVGIKTFWNLKTHMQEASQMATAHFPETLDKIFIIGAPYFFPTVWGWIKRWFDPNTVSKIFVLSHHDMKSTLEKYFDIDSIPKAYGGNLDWEYGHLPAMDGLVRERVGHDWIPGPSRWEGQMVPVGSVNGKDRERPPPIPEDKRHPYVKVARSTLPVSDREPPSIEAAAAGIAGMTVASGDGPVGATSVENAGAAETAVIPEPAVSEANTSTTGGHSEGHETGVTSLTESEKDAAIPDPSNGFAKPPMERFDTAAEALPSGP